ncbi:hypothetical protein TNCV_2707701 [Trichonephila clavipes]|nr:hypothetical protein TNCV_2707701 [Trichonephila clavipes]
MLFRKLLRGESIAWPIHRPEPSFKDLFFLAFISASRPQNVNLSIDAVEPHYLSQCLDPVDDLDSVFFHPELPVHVNKQADLPRKNWRYTN